MVKPRYLHILAASFAALALFAAGAAAHAAGGWRMFSVASDVSDYYASASASADVRAPKGLAIRNAGPRVASFSWRVSCDADDVDILPGKIARLDVSAADSCTVYGHASSDKGGKVRVELLRR